MRALPENPTSSDRQKAFVQAFVETGNATKAAEMAGYAARHAQSIGSRLASRPDIARQIRVQQMAFAQAYLVPAANQAILTILKDSKAPAGARVQAARLAYEAGGVMPEKGEEGGAKELHEMTAEELRAALDKVEAALAGQAVDVTPEEGIFG